MARGLTLQIKEVVSVPGSPPASVEIFPYFHSGTCASLGIGIEHLQIAYPVGAELLVVAQAAKHVAEQSPEGTLRLEIAPSTGVLDSATRLTNYLPTASSVFNYGSLSSREAKLQLRFGLLPFEIRKDLLRLEKAKTFEAKTEVIDRLSALGDPVELLDLFSIYRAHTPDKDLAYKLYAKKLQTMGFDEERIKNHLKCVQEWLDGKRDRACR